MPTRDPFAIGNDAAAIAASNLAAAHIRARKLRKPDESSVIDLFFEYFGRIKAGPGASDDGPPID